MTVKKQFPTIGEFVRHIRDHTASIGNAQLGETISLDSARYITSKERLFVGMRIVCEQNKWYLVLVNGEKYLIQKHAGMLFAECVPIGNFVKDVILAEL